jgi:hypothetical protein
MSAEDINVRSLTLQWGNEVKTLLKYFGWGLHGVGFLFLAARVGSVKVKVVLKRSLSGSGPDSPGLILLSARGGASAL